MADATVTPEVISRKEAKARGLAYFFPAIPCRVGHIMKWSVSGGCYGCALERARRWYAQNTERAKTNVSRRYYADPAKWNREVKEWQSANPEKVKRYKAKWAENNQGQIKETHKRLRVIRKDRDALLRKAWKAANPDKVRQQVKEYRERHPERVNARAAERRARERGAEGRYTDLDVKRLQVGQRWKCAYCRLSIKRTYHVDHIQPISRGGSNWPSNLQLLCPKCNNRKYAKDPLVFAQELGLLL